MTIEPQAAPDQPTATPHKSTAVVHGEVELEMLKMLGGELGRNLEKKSVDYHGAKMEIDGVDAAESVFVEAFAHVGPFKAGQRRKIATDALKFVALRADRPEAEFILAFADEQAKASVVGWLRAVVEQHGIRLVVVDIHAETKQKLVAAQVDQKAGMETQ